MDKRDFGFDAPSGYAIYRFDGGRYVILPENLVLELVTQNDQTANTENDFESSFSTRSSRGAAKSGKSGELPDSNKQSEEMLALESPPPLKDAGHQDFARLGPSKALEKLPLIMSDNPAYLNDNENLVRVFNAQNVTDACIRMSRDREKFTGFWELVRLMSANNGYRTLLQFDPQIEQNLLELKKVYLNFAEVIDSVLEQICLLGTRRHTERRVSPILLEGPPGVGKSHFCEELAKALMVDYQRLDCATITAGMLLTGSTSQWSGSQPGMLLEKVSGAKNASTMWLLDEINLARAVSNSPVMPVLLGMLEPKSSKNIRDEYSGVEFNISHNIFIAACNSTAGMSPALLSRFERFRISSPGKAQRRIVCAGLIQGSYQNVNITSDALDLLASNSVAIRELKRLIDKTVAKAFRQQRNRQDLGPIFVTELHVAATLRSQGLERRAFAEVEI